MERKIFTVAQINNYVKSRLDSDVLLRSVWLEAEISNFKAYPSGHFYFTLKDADAAISAVMFASSAVKLKFMPQNGSKVLVHGSITLYDKTGNYQIYVQKMEPAGEGALYLAYEQLKARLEKAGIFDAKHKKSIPQFPKCVAVITSGKGAAVRDIIQISGRRNPSVEIVVLPVLVQGENAAADIAKAIKTVNEWGGADVAIVGRGGGSIEDLWAFNEEIVARAIFESKLPIISAVGHETDFTIADFVADMRAPTPSAAAELAVPEARGFRDTVEDCLDRMERYMQRLLSENELKLERLAASRAFRYMLNDINEDEIYVNELYKRMERAYAAKYDRLEARFAALVDGLERLSPLNIMKKGYSLVYNNDGKLVKAADETNTGDIVDIMMSNSRLRAEIKEKLNGC